MNHFVHTWAMKKLTVGRRTALIGVVSAATLGSSFAFARTLDCTAFGNSGFAGSVIIHEDSSHFQDDGPTRVSADASFNLNWINRAEGPTKHTASFQGSLDGDTQNFAAGTLTVGESTLISVHGGTGEEKAGLKILLGLKRKNATLTYKGLLLEALCE